MSYDKIHKVQSMDEKHEDCREKHKMESMLEALEQMAFQKKGRCDNSNNDNGGHEHIYKSMHKIETMIVQNNNMGDAANKYLIRLQLRKCQLLGVDEKWDEIVAVTDSILNKLNSFQNEIDFTYRSSLEATVAGYRGFALMKQNRIDEAIISLTKSYEIRISSYKNVALVNEKREIDRKTPNLSKRKEFVQVEKALAYCCQKKGIASPLPPLTKFSRTVHLFDTGGTAVTNDDLVLSQIDGFHKQMRDGNETIYVEEKVDGANFGLSLSADGQIFAQNRSHYISSGDHAQFSPLASWLEENRTALTNILNEGKKRDNNNIAASQGLILYGEWVVARHSIPYHRLPSYFIAFDIYDRRAQRFWSRKRFHTIMKGSGIPVVPIIKVYKPQAKSSEAFRQDLLNLLETKSQFRSDGGPVEGIILRVDDESDTSQETGWLNHRLKVVRPDFVAGCSEHWSRRDIERQIIDYDFANEYLLYCYHCS